MPLHRWKAVPIVVLLALLATVLPLRLAPPVRAQEQTPPPTSVTMAGTIQSKLGCSSDWQPPCDKTFLTYDEAADLWQATFELPAGDYEYKAALNGTWAENYGAKAARNGANIALKLAAPTSVTFIYDHKTTFVTDSVNTPLAFVVGDFQAQLCAGQVPAYDCLVTWLRDPAGSGTASFITTGLKAGTYGAQAIINPTLSDNLPSDQIFGANGQPGGPFIPFTVAKDGDEIYFGFNMETKQLTISTEGAPKGSLAKQRAHWVNRDTIVWNVTGTPRFSYKLHYSANAELQLGSKGVSGGETIDLSFTNAGPGEAALKQFPHLAGFSAFKIAPEDLAKIPAALQGQLAVSAFDAEGKLLDVTALQIPGVLDDVFSYAGPLGVTYDSSTPTLRVWAPTARSVQLLRFADSGAETQPTASAMQNDPQSGVWSISGAPDWTGQFYLYEVEVYAPSTGNIETNRVTDPYSLSLATNSSRSQIVNLADPALAPQGWATLQKPALASPTDIALYELHVRDFSITDPSVPEEQRGTFKAFTQTDSHGMRHLKGLAQAGVTHIHLLPTFDIATIEEDKSKRQEPDLTQLATFPPDSEQQQATIDPIRDKDGFNWGYDPYHYNVPEGSYSTNPDGSTRIVEFREMVQALNGAGLRVVLDVVYNHTNASGQNPRSVLDKVVPGYYHRLNAEGVVEKSTCCDNTATEHRMMEKLMVDSVLLWARAYKVDGFRFDLMGHHMVSNMVQVREALDGLTVANDGVDGKSIYVYGEGWNFGEVQDNVRGLNATQINLAGTGIGTFNDRLRDGARGGTPFGNPREQGFLTGLWEAPNGYEQGDEATQRERLLAHMDWIRVGLAGNLKDFEFTDRRGETVRGEQVIYNGQPAGYNASPVEHIVYVSAHDNETLFDAVQLKAPASANIAERVRMHNLGLSLVALSQGVPFFHAGDDLLRSKSLDRNSYNSGDWFNRIDWTGATDNWGVGLPPRSDNETHWPLMKELLGNPALKPQPADIQFATANFRELLQIRRSSPLFRLQTAEEVQQHVSFLNTGAEQTPGLIVMQLSAQGEAALNKPYEEIVVLFNGTGKAQSFTAEGLQGVPLSLHPIQANGGDAVVKTASYDLASGGFSIPPRTAAVFVGTVAAQPAQPTAAPTQAAQPTAAQPTAAPAPTVAPTAVPAPAQPGAGGTSLPIVLGVVMMLVAVVVLLLRRRR